MRTLSAEHEKVYASGNYSKHVRVSIKDADGTWRDLTSYGGVNWLDSVTYTEKVDDPHRTATITLKREVDDLSLATLMETSPLNLGFAYPGTYAPLIDAGREVKVEAGLGYEGASSPVEWIERFRGYVDVPDWGAGEHVTLECRDLGAKEANAFIERERAYGLEDGAGGLLVWKPEESYSLDDLMTPQNPTGFYYKVTNAGTTGLSEPTWPTTIGGTVTDGTVEWTCEAATSEGVPLETVIQQLIDDNVSSPPTLYTPTSPGWNLNKYAQDRTPALDAIRTLVDQIGWDFRRKWRASASAFVPTLYTPDRSKTTPDRTFVVSDYDEVTRCAVDIAGIRNVIRVIYRDSADRWPDGTSKRKVIEVSDPTSIARYGRLFGEIAEEATPQLDTETEATALANAVLSDLSMPSAELELTAPYAPFVELADLYRFSANGRHFSSDQDLAIVGFTSTLTADGEGSTSYTVRGKPSGGYTKWHAKLVNPGVKPPRKQAYFSGGSATVHTTATVGGGRIELVAPSPSKDETAIWDGAEFHLHTASGFTPSDSTLVAIGKQNRVEVHALKPGQTYYAKAVPRGRDGDQIIRGVPTAEQVLVAGKLKALHFDPELGGMLAMPPNGNFESYFDGDPQESPPDFWSATAGEWNTDIKASEDKCRSGAKAIEFAATAVAAEIQSDVFAIVGGVAYILKGWLMKSSGTGSEQTAIIRVDWYDRAKGFVSSSDLTTTMGALTTATWTEVSSTPTAPDDATFARVAVAKGSAQTYAFIVDALSLTR